MKRYFMTAYIGSSDKGMVNGSMMFQTSNGGYLNRDTCVKMIEGKGLKTWDVVITNIVEMSESDYQQWNKKSE